MNFRCRFVKRLRPPRIVPAASLRDSPIRRFPPSPPPPPQTEFTSAFSLCNRRRPRNLGSTTRHIYARPYITRHAYKMYSNRVILVRAAQRPSPPPSRRRVRQYTRRLTLLPPLSHRGANNNRRRAHTFELGETLRIRVRTIYTDELLPLSDINVIFIAAAADVRVLIIIVSPASIVAKTMRPSYPGLLCATRRRSLRNVSTVVLAIKRRTRMCAAAYCPARHPNMFNNDFTVCGGVHGAEFVYQATRFVLRTALRPSPPVIHRTLHRVTGLRPLTSPGL